MSNRDTLAGISAIARLVAGGMLYRRLVTGVATVILLTVVLGVLVGTLLLGGLYMAYLLMIQHGMSADMAMLIVGGVLAVFIGLCVYFTVRIVRKLRDALMPIPAMPQVKRIANAFMDGFHEPRSDT